MKEVLDNVRPWWIETADVLAALRQLPDACVHCCVTSPPYFGLRDYGTGKWEGGDAGCQHKVRERVVLSEARVGPRSQGHQQEGFRDRCPRCGAIRVDQQIGLERTPAEFVARLVEVFEEVRRVLRPDGCMFLNVGDSYAGSSGSGGLTPKQRSNVGSYHNGGVRKGPGLKSKDLLMMPARLALALQEAGWYLRSEIIWAKSSPMPESVRDRPTKSHEQIFLLTRSPKYFYDQDAERVAYPEASVQRARYQLQDIRSGSAVRDGLEKGPKGDSAVRREYPPLNPDGRNLWTVWDDLRPEPFPAAHFATFPPDLPARAIRLGTSAHGVCSACGAPWVRVRALHEVRRRKPEKGVRASQAETLGQNGANSLREGHRTVKVETLGWEPSCDCEAAEPIGALVLDPFCGAATTGLVARRLGRRFVGIELNESYAQLGRDRIQSDAPMFNATTSASAQARESPEPSLFDTLEASE